MENKQIFIAIWTSSLTADSRLRTLDWYSLHDTLEALVQSAHKIVTEWQWQTPGLHADGSQPQGLWCIASDRTVFTCETRCGMTIPTDTPTLREMHILRTIAQCDEPNVFVPTPKLPAKNILTTTDLARLAGTNFTFAQI